MGEAKARDAERTAIVNSTDVYDFAATHLHAEGDMYEKLNEALFVRGGDQPSESVVTYRNRMGMIFVTSPERFAERFTALPTPTFSKELSPMLLDKLRSQVMSSGANLVNLVPGVLTEIANTMEAELLSPESFAMNALQKRQWSAFVIMMRLAEKMRAAFVKCDLAFRIHDPSAVN